MENFEGGCTAFRLFSSDEKALFEKMIAPIFGVKHTPLAVSTQVVGGAKYAFFCESLAMIPGAVSYNSLVIIYQLADKDPILSEIKTIEII